MPALHCAQGAHVELLRAEDAASMRAVPDLGIVVLQRVGGWTVEWCS